MTSPMLSRGEIVLARFPFTDLSGDALRPAVIVSQGQIGQDLVLAGISSVLRNTFIPTDFMVETTHPEFFLTGLRVASVIRAHKLAGVERAVIVRRLGRLGPSMQEEIDRLLRLVLRL